MKQAIFVILSVFAIGCNSDGDKTKESSENPVEQKTDVQFSKQQVKDFKSAAKVFNALPTPIEMAEIIKKSAVIYDPELLNDDKKTSDYVTTVERALNLGVYFADLSFTSVFDHPQESVNYLKAAQKMATELNILNVFNENITSRMESNMNNKDSLLTIISEAYLSTDNFLYENQMHSVSAAVLAGSWIEGLSIATRLRSSTGDTKLIKDKVSEQQASLKNLMGLLKDCKEAELAQIKVKLVKMEELYTEIKISTAADSTKTYEMSDETYKKISATISNIRTSIVE
ncbi:MAG: hypothetical protein NT150_11790 [Bacteroidetes bacterium]|nr:hypothetical protein [Bacteroidota bacterium]